MSNRQIPEIAKDLIAARKIIEDKNNWWGHEDGGIGLWHGKAKNLYCAVQALSQVAHHQKCYFYAVDLLNESAHELYNRGLVEVNDIIGHEAVMKVYDLTITKAMNKVGG